jgi:tetratricopeptide (TPR) repeat protein
MMPRADVSVIVRSMARPTLGDALRDLAAQRDVAAEVVVVAACGLSHPDVPPACGRHAVRLVRSDARLARAAAANAGLDAATGRWITFLDDDDRIAPEHLAGLLAGARDAPQARVITSLATVVYADGRTDRIGGPFSLAELFERNFIHLSSALVARELVDEGCRFDETLEVLEDWEFMLQLAQRAAVHFVPVATFSWNAEAGDSGAGRGANQDAARFAANRDRVYAKWRAAREALAARVEPLLARAVALAQAHRLAEADAACNQALAISVNDPFALNVRAMVLREAGRLDDARRVQAHACAVRPDHGGFVYNLALLDVAAGDLEAARRHARRAVRLEPAFEPARSLATKLGA